MDIVVIKTDDLRQLIKDELGNLNFSQKEVAQVQPPITTKELCKFLGVTEPTIIRWRKKGKIPFLSIGSAIRFNLSDVIKALEAGKKRKEAEQ